jgi:hypothetical protein
MRPGGDFEVFIQYKQGAMEKTIEVNQAQTVSGLPLPEEGGDIFTDLTITLKRVELSEKNARFYALATLSGYPPGSTPKYDPTSWISCADAEYIFNGISKDAGCADEETSSEGIKLWWGYVNLRDQIPKDARELTFRIFVNLENRPHKELYGPWEFNVPLK